MNVPVSIPPARTHDPVEGFLKRTGIGALAGGVAAAVVAGIFGRMAMHLVALSAPSMTGTLTENSNEIGKFTLAGTIFLAIFGAVSVGGPFGVLYVAISPLLAVLGRWRGLAFGVGLMSIFGYTVIDPDSVDFTRLGDPIFNVAAFLPLAVVFGILIDPIVGWLRKVVVLGQARWQITKIMSIVTMIVGLLTLFIMLVACFWAIGELLDSGFDRGAVGFLGIVYIAICGSVLHRRWSGRSLGRSWNRLLYVVLLLLLPLAGGIWLTAESIRVIAAGA